jgi:hypothetical protein
VSGTTTSFNVLSSPLPTDAPQALLDLLHHPERIHVHGSAPGYIQSGLTLYLTIDPPMPVPEPPILVTSCWLRSRVL